MDSLNKQMNFLLELVEMLKVECIKALVVCGLKKRS